MLIIHCYTKDTNMDFAKLKANAGQKSLEALKSEMKKLDSNERKSDERFWSPTVDKAGNGYAVIRFLPAPPNEDIPYIKTYDHGFQGPGGWYIENSLTTIGQQDPVSEFNSKLWNASTDDKGPERTQARKQKRRLHFISNIYVVTDPAHPENEGKVFLFKYGKKIFNKVREASEPPFDLKGRTPDNPAYDPVNAFDPFCMWTGANFQLKIRNVEGYRNYDQSAFMPVGPLSDDDDEPQKIHSTEYSLQAFLAPDQFKTYDELKQRLLKVLSEPAEETIKKAKEDDAPWAQETEAPKTKTKAPPKTPAKAIVEDDGEDDLEFFKSLAN